MQNVMAFMSRSNGDLLAKKSSSFFGGWGGESWAGGVTALEIISLILYWAEVVRWCEKGDPRESHLITRKKNLAYLTYDPS